MMLYMHSVLIIYCFICKGRDANPLRELLLLGTKSGIGTPRLRLRQRSPFCTRFHARMNRGITPFLPVHLCTGKAVAAPRTFMKTTKSSPTNYQVQQAYAHPAPEVR